jgi:hypothetical protein
VATGALKLAVYQQYRRYELLCRMHSSWPQITLLAAPLRAKHLFGDGFLALVLLFAHGWRIPARSFNMGDLTTCGDVLYNYLEAYETIPWPDLRYMFGEVFYGGHITDGMDRRCCTTYLEASDLQQ